MSRDLRAHSPDPPKWLVDAPASFELVDAVGRLTALPFVEDVLVLHRTNEASKFYILTTTASMQSIEHVVATMIQVENYFPNESFNYDVISKEKRHFVAPGARSIIHDPPDTRR